MPANHTLAVAGTRLTLDGQPFFLQGLSFFNVLYNPTFNLSEASRRHWLGVFQRNGINFLRLWCQWDFRPGRDFVDSTAETTMYAPDGTVRDESFARLAAFLDALDERSMVAEVCLFSNEREPYFLPVPAMERATAEMATRLKPWRNLILQIWNEHDAETLRLIAAAKAADPARLVTSSPGFSVGRQRPFDHIGGDAENRACDILTPHTVRFEAHPFWYVAPAQIQYLLDTYGKPVIDDEPARSGPILHGGVPGGTKPVQHVEHCRRVRALGGYYVYHHDMFQSDYGNPLIPPSGIPEPDFSPFHREVFDYLRANPTW